MDDEQLKALLAPKMISNAIDRALDAVDASVAAGMLRGVDKLRTPVILNHATLFVLVTVAREYLKLRKAPGDDEAAE